MHKKDNSAQPGPPAPTTYFYLCLLSALAYFSLSEGVRGYITVMLRAVQKIAEKLA